MLTQDHSNPRARILVFIFVMVISAALLMEEPPGGEGDNGPGTSLTDIGSGDPSKWQPETYYLEKSPSTDYLGSLAIDTVDVNGDGIDDILTHNPQNDTYPRARGPKNYVILGSWDRDLRNSTMITIDNVSHSFGIGDVNGDGYMEIASYPYPSYSSDHNYPQVGAPTKLLIRFGGPDGPSMQPDQEIELECNITPVDGKLIFTTAADIGDVNNDGYHDLVVIYRLADETRDPETEEAEMQVFYGTSSGLPADPDWSEPISEGFIKDRRSLSGISPGDYNGDGYGDMLGFCGAGSTSASAIEVRYGSKDGIGVTPDTILETGNHESWTQWRQAPIDYDGDGYDDVGVHYQDYDGGASRHQVHIFRGSSNGLTGAPGRIRSFNFTGNSGNNWPRTMFADYDGDGLHEMVVHNTSRTDSGYDDEHGYTIVLSKVDIEIFHNEGGTYPKVPRSFTYNLGWHKPYPIAVGDMDGDFADDLIVLRGFGGLERDDGPDIPASSGLWIIYGEGHNRTAGPVRYEGGSRVYSGLRSYEFWAGVNPVTTFSFDQIRLTLDPGGANVSFSFHYDPVKGGWFAPADHEFARLTSEPRIYDGPSGGFKWINFSVLFDWDWPHEDPCDVLLEYIRDGEVEYEFTREDLFSVENDLDLLGDLEVTGDIHGPIGSGDWVLGGELLTATGVRVVYEGTTDVYPHEGVCSIVLSDDDGNETSRSIPEGWNIDLSLHADVITDVDELLILTLEDLPGTAEAISNRTFSIRVDADLPRLEGLMPDTGDWISSNEVMVHVVANDTGSSGVDADSLEYNFRGPMATSGWTRNGLGVYRMGHVAEGSTTLDLADGTDYWVRWRVRDIAGNWNETDEVQIRVDTRNVTFSNPVPRDDQWQNSTPVQCGITIRDLEGSGIDVSTIEYRVSPRNVSEYGPWTPIDDGLEDSNLVDVRVLLDLAEGPYIHIQWRAADIAGNGLTVSRHYRVMVDTNPVTYSDFSPTGIQTSSDVDVSIRVHKGLNGSDIDTTTCLFRYSVGEGEFSRWRSADVETDGNEFLLRVRLEGLVEGEDNLVQFHVFDLARNGPAVSAEYRVLVDTTGPEFIEVLPPEGEVQEDTEVTVHVSIQDNYSGIDVNEVYYRYGTMEYEGLSTWMSLEVEEVDGVFKGSTTILLFRGRDNVVQLMASDIVGNVALSEYHGIRVNQLPVAVLKVLDGIDNITEGETIQFSAEGSFDPDGDELTYRWFIDGSTEAGEEGKLAELMLEAGPHTVKLVIMDPYGGRAETEIGLDVLERDDDLDVEDPNWGWFVVLVIAMALVLSALYVRSRKDGNDED
jgi:hypothetical protein